MSTHVQGALIIAAAVLIAAFGATYMLSPERDVERCVEARGPISEPTQEEWARFKGRAGTNGRTRRERQILSSWHGPSGGAISGRGGGTTPLYELLESNPRQPMRLLC